MPAVDVTQLATPLMLACEAAGVPCWTVCVEERSDTVAVVTWHLYTRGVIELAAEVTYPTQEFGVEALTRAMLERL